MPDIMFTCIASVRLNSVLEPERKVLLAEKIDSSETEVVTAHKQFRYTFQNQMHLCTGCCEELCNGRYQGWGAGNIFSGSGS